MAEKVSSYTSTKLVSGKNLKERLNKKFRSPFYKHHAVLETEDECDGVHEFVMDQRIVTDDKLVHVGVTILQQSKLMFLKFVDFLREFLIPGAYQTVYCGKINLLVNFLYIYLL